MADLAGLGIMEIGGTCICPKCLKVRSNDFSKPCANCEELARQHEEEARRLKKNPLKIRRISLEELKHMPLEELRSLRSH